MKGTMKGKFSSIWRVAIAVVMVLSLSLVMAVPVSAAVSGVNIEGPTEASPVYVQAGDNVTVTANVTTGADGSGDLYIRIGTAPDYVVDYQEIVEYTTGDNVIPVELTIPAETEDGNYKVVVIAKQPEDAGTPMTDTEENAIIVDSTAPAIAIDTLTAPNGDETWQAGTVEDITWASADIGDANLLDSPISLYYSTDGGNSWTGIATGQGNSGTYEWDSLPDVVTESCKVKIVAEDKAGNTSEDVSDAVFTIWGVDDQPPTDVAVTAPADNAYVSGDDYEVTATATDDESGIDNVLFEYSTDEGATWVTIGSTTEAPYSVVWDTTSLADSTVVQVRTTATNGVGATASDTDTNITIDNSEPDVTLVTPADGAFIKGDAYAVTATASDNLSDIAIVTFEYYDEGQEEWAIIDTDGTPDEEGIYEASWDTTDPIGDDTGVQVRAVATNGSGLENTDINTNITVDNTDPTGQADTLTAPNGGEIWKTGTVQEITWTATDIDDDNLLDNPISLYYSIDGGTIYILIESGLANDGSYDWTVSAIPSETCKVKIEAEDKAGNTKGDDSDAVFSIWGIDNTPPTVTLTSPVDGAFTTSNTNEVTATAADAESDIASVTFSYSLDEGENWTQIGDPDTEAPYAVNLDTSGGAVDDSTGVWVRAVAKNGVGVETTAINTGIVVDNSEPTVTVTAPENVAGVFIGGAAYEVTANATDEHSGIVSVLFEYQLNEAGDWIVIDTDTTPDGDTFSVSLDTTTLADGDTVTVRSTATNGVEIGATDTNTEAATVDNTLPDVATTALASPNGGESWARGSAHDITWTAADITDENPLASPITLYYSTDSGVNWIEIATGEANDGAYAWTVPAVSSQTCLVKIVAEDKAGNTSEDVSDAVFTIYAVETIDPTVTVNNPDGGESYTVGSTQTITWTATDDTTRRVELAIDLYYSADGGETWTTIASDEANDGAYAWTVPDIDSSTQCLVKVKATDTVGNVGTDLSDAVFSISQAPITPEPVTSIELKTGWNFISVPKKMAADSDTFGELLTGIDWLLTYSYDPDSGWTEPGADPNTPVKVLEAYWIKTASAGTITLFYAETGQQVPADKPLKGNAWNAIGFSSPIEKDAALALKSIEGSWSTLITWDAETQSYEEAIIAPAVGEEANANMAPCRGYWVWVTQDDVLSAISG